MREYANAIVDVPKGSMRAQVVIPVNPPRRPPAWLPAWQVSLPFFYFLSQKLNFYFALDQSPGNGQALVVVVPAGVLVGAVHQIGPLGPAAAATWLGLNWWLH